MSRVEQLKARLRRCAELGERNSAVEVGVGRRDRLGNVEQGVARGSLRPIVPVAARPARGIAGDADLLVARALGLLRLGLARSTDTPHPDLDLGSDLPFVLNQLLRIDLAV